MDTIAKTKNTESAECSGIPSPTEFPSTIQFHLVSREMKLYFGIVMDAISYPIFIHGF